jgi:SP family galactose:H+ symporter-like MFS transporter
MVSTYQLMITVGILAAFLSDTAFPASGEWRWMLGVVAVPAGIFFMGVLALPDSPRRLMMKGRDDDARAVLKGLRNGMTVVDQEMREIAQHLKVKEHSFALLRKSPDFRRSLTLGIMLQVVQQLTGINVVMYYAPRIFGLVGYSGHQAQLWGTVIVGAVNVLATFVAIGLVDRWGRRPILLTGFTVMATGMGPLGGLLALGISTHLQQIAAVAMLLLFIAGFAMSARPMIWILCSEIQPITGRDFGIAGIHVHKLGGEHRGRRHVPDHTEYRGSRTHVLDLRGTERQFHCPHFLLCARNTPCPARTDRAESDGWQAAARDRALSADSVPGLCIS